MTDKKNQEGQSIVYKYSRTR